jgi:CHASE3 domain sensor protein
VVLGSFSSIGSIRPARFAVVSGLVRRTLLLAASIALLSILWRGARLTSELQSIEHLQDVIDTIGGVRTSARQARDVLRLYLQTSDQKDLAAFERVTSDAWTEVWRFKEMTLDNPRQVANAPLFEQRLSELFHFLAALADEKRAGKLRPLAERVADEEQINDRLRLSFRMLMVEEKRLQAERRAELERSVLWLQISALAFVAAASLISVLYRSEKHRLQTNPQPN